MVSTLFPLAYGIVFALLLVQAFQMMRLGTNPFRSKNSDRTGLLTIHPELLDTNGSITEEDLMVVYFQSKARSEDSIND